MSLLITNRRGQSFTYFNWLYATNNDTDIPVADISMGELI